MLERFLLFWSTLGPAVQDAALLAALVVPLVIVWIALRFGYAPRPMGRVLVRRYRAVNLVFVGLIALSVAMSIALMAQERGLRDGSARAADKFDLIIAAPGSEVTALLAAVYLQPAAVPLLEGQVFNEVFADPRVDFAAPLAFGDSYRGAPVVGTTETFVRYLSDNRIEGRIFDAPFDAVVGADIDLALGTQFVPAHGRGAAAQPGLHGQEITVVGRIARTGTPWDRAILTPIEGVWQIHAMGTGKDPSDTSLGPPYDAAAFPGTPAIIVRANTLAATFAVQTAFNQRADAMAFFPGTVLSRVHTILGDARRIVTVLLAVTQTLVAISVLTGLFMLTRLFRPHLRLLRTLGAPGRFLTAIVWSHAVLLLTLGTLAGVGLGLLAAKALSRIVTAETGIAVTAQIGWPDIHAAAGFLTSASGLAVILGIWAARAARRGPL